MIDLKGGQVVLGRAGRRESYRAVKSVLCNDASPASVANAFSRLGLSHVYVADLDAIAGAEPDWNSYDQIASTAKSLWIDAGIATLDRAVSLLRWSHGCEVRLICGLESLTSVDDLRQMLDEVGIQRVVVSLDLLKGNVRTQVQEWAAASPLQVAGTLIRMGVASLILLDVARVGIDKGTGTRSLCRDVRSLSDRIEITCGGGISTAQDMHDLANDGCQFALVASALHDGRLGRVQLDQITSQTDASASSS